MAHLCLHDGVDSLLWSCIRTASNQKINLLYSATGPQQFLQKNLAQKSCTTSDKHNFVSKKLLYGCHLGKLLGSGTSEQTPLWCSKEKAGNNCILHYICQPPSPAGIVCFVLSGKLKYDQNPYSPLGVTWQQWNKKKEFQLPRISAVQVLNSHNQLSECCSVSARRI